MEPSQRKEPRGHSTVKLVPIEIHGIFIIHTFQSVGPDITWHDETATLFVCVISAILVTVAESREGNASARSKAAEFSALGPSSTRFGSVTVLFVFRLRTIGFLVANPRFPNAIACDHQKY